MKQMHSSERSSTIYSSLPAARVNAPVIWKEMKCSLQPVHWINQIGGEEIRKLRRIFMKRKVRFVSNWASWVPYRRKWYGGCPPIYTEINAGTTMDVMWVCMTKWVYAGPDEQKTSCIRSDHYWNYLRLCAFGSSWCLNVNTTLGGCLLNTFVGVKAVSHMSSQYHITEEGTSTGGGARVIY